MTGRFTEAELTEATELLEALELAAEGDSNDDEIRAGSDLADFVRRVTGLTEGDGRG